MPSEDAERVSISVRMSKSLATRLRTFVRDNAGKPMYLQIGPFVEAAIREHLDRIEAGLKSENLGVHHGEAPLHADSRKGLNFNNIKPKS